VAEWVRGFRGSGRQAAGRETLRLAQGDAARRLRLLLPGPWRHVRAAQCRPWRTWRFARRRFFASLRVTEGGVKYSEGGSRRELEPFGTEARVGNVVAQSAILRSCSTDWARRPVARWWRFGILTRYRGPIRAQESWCLCSKCQVRGRETSRSCFLPAGKVRPGPAGRD